LANDVNQQAEEICVNVRQTKAIKSN